MPSTIKSNPEKNPRLEVAFKLLPHNIVAVNERFSELMPLTGPMYTGELYRREFSF